MSESLGGRLLSALGRALKETLVKQVNRRSTPTRAKSRTRPRSGSGTRSTGTRSTSTRSTRTTSSGRRTSPKLSSDYPGDFVGVVEFSYAPQPGARPDPGEVVWTWVVFEEDFSQGKDRPVLLIGRDGDWLLGLPLTSKDHDRDEAQERRAGRYWVDVGTGAWDRNRRPSEARVDRVVRVNPDEVRREGSVLDKRRFDVVVAAVRRNQNR